MEESGEKRPSNLIGRPYLSSFLPLKADFFKPFCIFFVFTTKHYHTEFDQSQNSFTPVNRDFRQLRRASFFSGS